MNAIPFHRFLIPCLSALVLTFPVYAAPEKDEASDTLEVNTESIMQAWEGVLPGMLAA